LDIKPWPNTGGADDNGGVSTAEDECIIHYTRVNSTGTRHVSVNRDNDVWVSGTYHGWPPAIAAAHATLTELEKAPVAQRVWELGERLMQGFNRITTAHDLPMRLAGMPPMPQASYPQGVSADIEQLFSQLLARGYFIHPIRPWFISAAHTMDDIEQTLAAIEDAASDLRRT
jgi:glutamate-1-semialdehyde aminotransferase